MGMCKSRLAPGEPDARGGADEEHGCSSSADLQGASGVEPLTHGGGYFRGPSLLSSAWRGVANSSGSYSNLDSELLKAEQDDGPGTYRVISAGPRLKALPVSKDYDRTSAKVGEVALEQVVSVLEVAAELNDGRRRARIANPPGWITLMATKNGVRFATKQSDTQAAPEKDYLTIPWVQNVSHMIALDAKIKTPEKKTAIVTFAGKRNMDYIDGAVLLGRSIQEHAPGYMMVAIVIENMKDKHQETLRKAGWKLVVVPNWDRDYCGEDCDLRFLTRWHDSFEKINIFRLGFGRVLFFDADTYVFSPRVKELLTKTRLKRGHIAMAPDGCKKEYNSGVMLFRPSVEIFRQMLELVVTRKREQILDQNIINAAYAGKIKELDREFNCVDIMGVQPGMTEECPYKCSANVVVAHFTGHPKPTAAKRRLLAMVRRPESPETTCKNTNFGSCKQWSQYYCDIRKHKNTLSKNLQGWLKGTGECCHTPFDPHQDDESCKDCPSQLRITAGAPFPEAATGSFMKSSIEPTKFNGGKPIYVKANSEGMPVYLYYVQKQVLWMIGTDYQHNSPYAFAQVDATCPRDVGKWHTFVSGQWSWIKDVNVQTESLANGTQAPMLWDIESRAWVPDHGKHATFEEDFE